jgi:hypothetical protein
LLSALKRSLARLGCGAALSLASSACHSRVPLDARANAAPEAPLHQGPLTDFVPAPGLRWLIAGSPAYFARQPAFAEPLARLFSAERLDGFALGTGIDLRRTEHAALAAYELGQLYLVDASGWVSAPELRFAERAAGSALSERPHPRLWRVSGLVSGAPQALVRIDDRVLAVAVGDPTLARVVEAYATGRLERTPPALRGAALSTLPEDVREPAPLALYALGPFEGEWAAAAGGLLEGALAFSASVRASDRADDARLELHVVLSGTWDPATSGEQLLRTWSVLAESELGRLLALNTPLREPRARASSTLLELELALDARPLLAGLHAAVAGSVNELLQLPVRPAQ